MQFVVRAHTAIPADLRFEVMDLVLQASTFAIELCSPVSSTRILLRERCAAEGVGAVDAGTEAVDVVARESVRHCFDRVWTKLRKSWM